MVDGQSSLITPLWKTFLPMKLKKRRNITDEEKHVGYRTLDGEIKKVKHFKVFCKAFKRRGEKRFLQ